MCHRWPRPILAVADPPEISQRAVQQLDEPVGNLPTAVEALVNDESRLRDLSAPLANEFILSVLAGVGHIDITDCPAAEFFHTAAIGVNPRKIAQARFSAERLDQHFARTLER